MGKLNVCVIFGGDSSEHDVSRVSARNVINNLDKNKYEIYILGITKKGQWLLYEGTTDKLDNGDWEKHSVKRAIISPDAQDKGLIVFNDDNTYERIKIDVAYLILHGRNGEDGTVQGLLELAKIPYTGPKVLSSALCMDKSTAKLVLQANGIPQSDWLVFKKDDMKNEDDVIAKVRKKFTYPVFVKPSGAGSSIGAGKAGNDSELINALETALIYDSKAIVEEYIDAIEIECGIVGNDAPKVALLGQVVTDNEFYDYEAKYTAGVAGALIPAPISEEKANEINEIAKKAYLAMECRGLTRIDFFIEKSTGRVILNELNTLPGCTDSSMFPTLWQKSGVEFKEILDEIIGYAME